MPPTETQLRRWMPRFEDDAEDTFQTTYYFRIRGALRLTAGLLAFLLLLFAGRDYIDTDSPAFVLRYDGPQVFLYLLVLGLTFVRGFERFWQPVMVLAGWCVASFAFHELATFFGASAARLNALPNGPGSFGMGAFNPPPPSGGASGALAPFSAETLLFSLQACILMICLAAFRLQFVWALMLQVGILCIGVATMTTELFVGTPNLGGGVIRFLQPSLLVMLVVLLTAFTQERLVRMAHLTTMNLAALQAAEHEKRVETEQMLHVLSQAIGGIVHDLGNPLTSVQTGADTLREFVQMGHTDSVIVTEFTDIIGSGAHMLNYLRLSLIEQTRVLEGKPTPVELKPVGVRELIEIGARYQKPRFLGGREVTISGELASPDGIALLDGATSTDADATICGDAMKLVTVFMNLIGNALKYSDGEVRVVWHRAGEMLLIGVLDKGLNGEGISRDQADKLFAAFGRLKTHAKIEGTGLGLVSVRQVMEAHGGEAFIEGYAPHDATPTQSRFSTAHESYPTLLRDGFCTAFVVSCPLAKVQEERVESVPSALVSVAQTATR